MWQFVCMYVLCGCIVNATLLTWFRSLGTNVARCSICYVSSALALRFIGMNCLSRRTEEKPLTFSFFACVCRNTGSAKAVLAKGHSFSAVKRTMYYCMVVRGQVL